MKSTLKKDALTDSKTLSFSIVEQKQNGNLDKNIKNIKLKLQADPKSKYKKQTDYANNIVNPTVSISANNEIKEEKDLSSMTYEERSEYIEKIQADAIKKAAASDKETKESNERMNMHHNNIQQIFEQFMSMIREDDAKKGKIPRG